MTFGTGSLGAGAAESVVAPFDPCAPRAAVGRAKHEGAGYGVRVTALRFGAWAHEQAHFPTVEQVMSRFGCCRATAHRWLNALEDAYGIERKRRGKHGRRRQPATVQRTAA